MELSLIEQRLAELNVRAGTEVADYKIIHNDRNAVVHLPQEDVVIKIFAVKEHGQREHDAHSLLESERLPVPKSFGQDKTLGIMTYQYHRTKIGFIDWLEMGKTISYMHQLPVPASLTSLRVFDPLDKIASLLEQEEDSLASSLLARAQRLARQVSTDSVFVHGSLFPSNIIATGPGPALIIDYEEAGRGNPLWDVASIMIAKRRFGLDPVAAERFVLGWCDNNTQLYRSLMNKGSELETMIDLQEIYLAAKMLASSHNNYLAYAEWVVRANLIERDQTGRWDLAPSA